MDPVYAGMICGENARPGDMPCNPAKRKVLNNMRMSTREVDTGLKVPRKMTLEQALEWIAPDELVEVTPKFIRVRKAILSADARKKLRRQTAAMEEGE